MEKKNQVPKYPPLRFPEFTDEWKEVKLGEVTSERNETNTPTLPLLSITANKGVIPQTDSEKKDVSNADKSKYKRICSGDIGYNTMRMWQGRSALSFIEGIVSPAYTIVTPLKGVSPLFLSYLIKRPRLIYEFWTHSQGLVEDTLNCKYKDFAQITITIPSLSEQRKIAALLSLIDERIEVQNAIIKEREVAKTLLSKELLTPEDDWTEYAVQDCLTYEQPAKYIVKHTDYSSDSTLTPVLTANKGFILGYTSEQGIYQKGACIIFDDFTLDCKYVPFAFKVKSSAIKILQARKGFDIRFMFEVIKSLSLSPFAHKRHYISEVEPIKILVPSFAKQEKIARLFEALDERLAVEKEYATLLQKQKAYLLRQMFV